MENIAQWIAAAAVIALVLWLIVILYKNHQAWEQDRRERKAIEEETAYWREVAEAASQRAKQMDILTQNVAATPSAYDKPQRLGDTSAHDIQDRRYEKVKADALARRIADQLDKGAGVPLDAVDKTFNDSGITGARFRNTAGAERDIANQSASKPEDWKD